MHFESLPKSAVSKNCDRVFGRLCARRLGWIGFPCEVTRRSTIMSARACSNFSRPSPNRPIGEGTALQGNYGSRTEGFCGRNKHGGSHYREDNGSRRTWSERKKHSTWWPNRIAPARPISSQ